MAEDVLPHNNRTRRAGLTAFSQLLQMGVTFIIGMLVTPRIVQGLGVTTYGGWAMVVQVIGYLALADFGNGTILKLRLAAQQHIDDGAAKRKQVGATLGALLLATPIYLVVALVLVWSLPRIVRLSDVPVSELRVAATLIVLTLLTNRFFAIPSYILFGTNQDYKARRVKTVIATSAALLDLVVIWFGWGIVGLAANKLLGAIALLCVGIVIVRRNVAWFGIAKPGRNDVTSAFRQNSWFVVSQWGSTLSEATDAVLIGFTLGPGSVTIYILTAALIRQISVTFSAMLSSGNPGLGDLFGRGELSKLRALRSQMEIVALGFFGVIGSVLLVGNRSFVTLWVGPDLFAGQNITLGLILMWLLLTISRAESGLLNGCMQIKTTILTHLAAASISVIIASMLAPTFGLAGIVLGFVCGRLVAIAGYSMLLSQVLKQPITEHWKQLARPLLMVVVLFSTGYFLSSTLPIYDWFSLLIACGITGLVASWLMWRIGFNPILRTQLTARAVSFR